MKGCDSWQVEARIMVRLGVRVAKTGNQGVEAGVRAGACPSTGQGPRPPAIYNRLAIELGEATDFFVRGYRAI